MFATNVRSLLHRPRSWRPHNDCHRYFESTPRIAAERLVRTRADARAGLALGMARDSQLASCATDGVARHHGVLSNRSRALPFRVSAHRRSACWQPDARRHASTRRCRSHADAAASSAPTYLLDRTKLASLAATAAGSSLRRNGGRRGRVRRLRARPGRRRGQQGALLAAFLWVLTQEPDVDPVRVPEATGAPIRRHRRRDRYRLDGVADQPPPGR